MLRYLQLAVLLSPATAVRVGQEYYPRDCHRESFPGSECLLICRGKDACNGGVSIPRSPALKNFIVRCEGRDGVSCNSLTLKNMRDGVQSYFMCIKKTSCNSVERIASTASFVYCEPRCQGIQNKGVKEINTKNDTPVVIFSNGVAVGRALGATGKDAGVIPNGEFFLLLIF